MCTYLNSQIKKISSKINNFNRPTLTTKKKQKQKTNNKTKLSQQPLPKQKCPVLVPNHFLLLQVEGVHLQLVTMLYPLPTLLILVQIFQGIGILCLD